MKTRKQKIKKSRNQGRATCGILVACSFGFLVFWFFGFWPLALAGNISPQPAEHWAWNDAIGWIDFAGIDVQPAKLTGFGTSSAIGEIAVDCATTSVGNICAANNFKVTNDGYGNLTGYAWNDAVGWISFWCGNVSPTDCQTSNYQVTIDEAGEFRGWAWNDSVGWISFNCDHSSDGGTNQCATSNYKVKTSWIPGTPVYSGTLTSSVFDAGARVALNSVLWRGTLNGLSSSSVRFRIASSNCANGKTNPPACDDAGAWRFLGPNNSLTDYYIPTAPNAPAAIDTRDHNNARYFRYRVFIDSNVFGTITPEVNDVIINWSI